MCYLERHPNSLLDVAVAGTKTFGALRHRNTGRFCQRMDRHTELRSAVARHLHRPDRYGWEYMNSVFFRPLHAQYTIEFVLKGGILFDSPWVCSSFGCLQLLV